jgi:hypothetical protein
VYDVEPEEQRDSEAGLLDRDPLRLADRFAAPEVENAPDPAGADRRLHVPGDRGAGNCRGGGHHVELPELFRQRHAADQLRRHGARRPDGAEPGCAGGDQGEDAAPVQLERHSDAIRRVDEVGEIGGAAARPEASITANEPPKLKMMLERNRSTSKPTACWAYPEKSPYTHPNRDSPDTWLPKCDLAPFRHGRQDCNGRDVDTAVPRLRSTVFSAFSPLFANRHT